MALLESNSGNIGSGIIDFNLISTDRKSYSVESFKDKKILVIIFMCNHCPYVKAVIGRFISLQNKYYSKNVQFIGISSNDVIEYPEDSYENMIIFAGERKINFPYLFDENQETAKKYDAVCTPDIYVYDDKRILKYRGRLDDNWKEEEKVTRYDLDDAISSLLNNGKIEFEQIPSMGCSIKWKK